MPRFLFLNPTLRARNVRALAEWYRDALGFEIRLLWQEPPTHAMVGRDEIRLAIAARDAEFGPASVYLHVEGVDALYAEFLGRNVVVLRAPKVTDYRMKDFALCDPEGNCLTIGEMVETAVPA
jgi:uncharacterized glyoxalase superfamily protein PhnB